MRNYIQTDTIILKRIRYKDADRILTIYTKELGKVSAKAKGVSKISSKKRSHLELLNKVNLYLVETKVGYLITQAQVINTYSKLKKDLQSISYAYYILETFEILVPENEDNELLYEFLIKTIEQLENKSNLDIVNAFNVKLLSLLGYYSNKSHSNLPENMKTYLKYIKSHKYGEITDDLLNKSQNNQYNPQIAINTHEFLREYTEDITERKIKSKLNL